MYRKFKYIIETTFQSFRSNRRLSDNVIFQTSFEVIYFSRWISLVLKIQLIF